MVACGLLVQWEELRLERHGFNSRPFRFQVTTQGKLFTHMCLCHQAV